MPPYPPPHRPPPRRADDHGLSVTLQLGELLGEGGSSFVYAATVVSVSTIDVSGYDERQVVASFPPLAVKMARRLHRGHIAREAWFYDDMHELQGSVIPRCYGWFDAVETTGFKGDEYAPERNRRYPDDYPEPWSEGLQYLSAPRNRISVLVLERMGKILSQWGHLTPDDKCVHCMRLTRCFRFNDTVYHIGKTLPHLATTPATSTCLMSGIATSYMSTKVLECSLACHLRSRTVFTRGVCWTLKAARRLTTSLAITRYNGETLRNVSSGRWRKGTSLSLGNSTCVATFLQ